jgi:hypothetical protein
MSDAIPPTDNVFRGAHYPVAFKGKIFQYGKFINLVSDDKNPRFVEASFIWQRYAPSLFHVHAYGCRTARKRNKKKPKSRHVYCGAYHLGASTVRQLARTAELPEVLTADIVHKIENDEIAHAALKVELRDDVDEEAAEHVKTVIADRLWNGSRGPSKHRCRVDRKLTAHPSAAHDIAPLGSYVDDRTISQQVFYLIRYWYLYFVWKARGTRTIMNW